ncbi:glycosyltransferase family 39 protein [Candidatus Poribacteria bacterium]|nr:glycosyltransferase family 39 protein [Candidatus Poribacteria bacterium]
MSEPILFDEAFTFMTYASKPFYVGLSTYSSTNNHLLNTFLVHIAYLLFGNEPWALRLPALFAGILLVPTAYVVTRIFFNKDAALLAAGIIACSSPLIRYSILARGYSLMFLIFLLLLGLAAYLRQSSNSSAWLLFGTVAALGFYAMPIMIYPFGIVVVWLLLSIAFQETSTARGILLKQLFKALLIAGLLALALYSPIIIMTGLKPIMSQGHLKPEPWREYVSTLYPFLRICWGDWNKDMPVAVSYLLAIGFPVSLVFHKRISRYRIPVVLAACIWLIPMIFIYRVLLIDRVWLFLLPLYVASASSGLSYIVEPVKAKLGNYRSIAVPVAAIALSLWMGWNVLHTEYIYDPTGTLRDAEEITVFLKEYLRPGDRVIVPAASTVLRYYFILYGVPVGYLSSDVIEGERILVVENEARQRVEVFVAQQGITLRERYHNAFPNYGAPKPVKKYKFATIYEIHRKSHAVY